MPRVSALSLCEQLLPLDVARAVVLGDPVFWVVFVGEELPVTLDGFDKLVDVLFHL